MEARTCCLCREGIGDKKGKNKQKKLYGESFAAERKWINDFCIELYNVSVESIYSDRMSIVCYICLQKLAKIIKIEAELRNLKGEITSFLENVWQTLARSTVTLQKRKQNATDIYSGLTPTKVPRTKTFRPTNVSVRIF